MRGSQEGDANDGLEKRAVQNLVQFGKNEGLLVDNDKELAGAGVAKWARQKCKNTSLFADDTAEAVAYENEWPALLQSQSSVQPPQKPPRKQKKPSYLVSFLQTASKSIQEVSGIVFDGSPRVAEEDLRRVAIGVDSTTREIVGEDALEPQCPALVSPCCVRVSVKAVNRDNINWVLRGCLWLSSAAIVEKNQAKPFGSGSWRRLSNSVRRRARRRGRGGFIRSAMVARAATMTPKRRLDLAAELMHGRQGGSWR